MSKQLMTKKAVLVFSLIGGLMLAALAADNLNTSRAAVETVVQNKCATVTSTDIVKSIYRQIKTRYDGQQSHINVRVKDNVVTLEGWATTKAVKRAIEQYAKRTACVKRVVNNLTIGIGGGCGPGQIKCGDICISSQSECNIGMPEN